jgi:hypothetical protein
VYVFQLAADLAVNASQVEGLQEMSSELLARGDDLEVAALSGKLRVQRLQLEAMQSPHDVSVCVVKFRPAEALVTDRGNMLGKLAILDSGESHSGIVLGLASYLAVDAGPVALSPIEAQTGTCRFYCITIVENIYYISLLTQLAPCDCNPRNGI